jgi:hypothetical protein
MVKLGKIALIGLCLSAVALTQVQADQTTVSFDSGTKTMFDQGNTALFGGTAADGDGDVLQLGYFTGANFSGQFVVLAGETSANGAALIPGSNGTGTEPYSDLSIGDLSENGAGDGTFALSLDFITSSNSGNNLPAAGTQLALRFYNTTTITPSSLYNTVTSSLWVWAAPATPPSTVTLSLDDANLVWESIARLGQSSNTAFHTTIPIPEPSTFASMLTGAGMLGFVVIRRRRR